MEELKRVKKKKEIHFDSKQTVKFLASSSKFRDHTVPVWARAVCAQSMGVLPCRQQLLFVSSAHCGAHCAQSPAHQHGSEVRDLSGRKGRVTSRRRKNKAMGIGD